MAVRSPHFVTGKSAAASSLIKHPFATICLVINDAECAELFTITGSADGGQKLSFMILNQANRFDSTVSIGFG